MAEARFAAWRGAHVRALLLGKRIDLRALDRQDSLTVAPLSVATGEQGFAVLFRYGAVVLFNVTASEEASFLQTLRAFVDEPLDRPEDEEAEIVVDGTDEERVDAGGAIRLHAVSMERLFVVADVLAKSVILAFDETRVGRVFDRIEPVAEALRRSGRSGAASASQLLDHISDVLITQHRMVGRVEVTEKPELVWDRPDLERLYMRLQEEYELRERHRALSRKLELISLTATTSLGVVETRRSLRVEWYIVILIVIEILLTLYELFVARGHG